MTQTSTRSNKPLIYALTSLLTALLVIVGGITPASAASKLPSFPLGSTYSVQGDKLSYGQATTITVTWFGYSYTPGQKITLKLERKIGSGAWSKLAQKDVSLPASRTAAQFNVAGYTNSNTTTNVSYRISSLANAHVAKTTIAKPVTVTYSYRYPNGIPITKLYYNNYNFTQKVHTHPNNVAFKIGLAPGDYKYYPNDKASLWLQRKIGTGAWTTISKTAIALPLSNKNNTLTVPAYKTSKAKETVYYRVHVPKSGNVDKAATSSTLQVSYINQAKYTGQTKAYYDMVKTYCPTALITVAKGGLSNGAAGYYTGGSYRISISDIVNSYSTTNKKAVTYHECAHLKQWQLGATQTIMAKYFVNDAGGGQKAVSNFSAYEHAADCASKAANSGGYLGYGGYCNSKEIAYGKQLISGKKWW